MSDTRQRLMTATAQVLRDQGIAGLSARTIATVANVNQALIFYHFATVDGLTEQACRDAADTAAAFYRERFDSVSSLTELLQLGRTLHRQEREAGNVAMMAQVMAGGQRSPVLAQAGRYAMDRWVAEIEPVVARLLVGTPLADIADVAGLSRAIAGSFIGLELYDGVDPAGSTAALDALERLSVLADVVTDLGPVARQALRRRLQTARRR